MSPGTVGAINELKVGEDLLVKGYDVFRALSPTCSCDLVALKNKRLLRVEVKTARYSAGGLIMTGSYKKEKSDILASVLWKDNIIIYNPKLPEGELR